MNQRQALAKARKLWGPNAGVADRLKKSSDGWCDSYGAARWGRYNINSGTFACNDGKGKVQVFANSPVSWEDAFERAKHCYKYWELPGKHVQTSPVKECPGCGAMPGLDLCHCKKGKP